MSYSFFSSFFTFKCSQKRLRKEILSCNPFVNFFGFAFKKEKMAEISNNFALSQVEDKNLYNLMQGGMGTHYFSLGPIK